MKLRDAGQACTARVFILSSVFAVLGFAFLHSLAAGAQIAETSDQSYYKNARPLLDCPLPDILKATAELQGIEPAGNQDELPFILDKAEKVTKDLLAGMPNLIAREDEVQATLSHRGRVRVQRQLRFNYMIVIHWNVTYATFEEYRSDAKRTGPWQIPAEDYTLTTGFASQWLLFLPSNRSGARFRYLGQQTNGGVRCYVVAFAQIPGSATFIGTVSNEGRSLVVMYQGIAWIDKASFRIVRLRTDLLAPRPEIKLVYLVVLDTLNSDFGNFVQIRGALKKLFAEERADSATYALIALAQNARVVQQLTTDPTAVLRAVENKQFTKFILANEQSDRAQRELQLRRMLEEFCQKCPCGQGELGRMCSTSPEVGRFESFATTAGEENANQLRSFLQQLRGLVEQLGMVSGRRTMVLISDGFTIQPGRDLFELIAIYLRNPEIVSRNTIARLDPQIESVLRLADGRNVVFYTLDSRGAYVIPAGGYDASAPPMSSKMGPVVMPDIHGQKTASAMEKADGLQALADATGGLFFGNTNNMLNSMRHALADGRAYYVLAYTSSNPAADGKFRKIQVVVDEKNLRVRAKQGYWAPVQ